MIVDAKGGDLGCICEQGGPRKGGRRDDPSWRGDAWKGCVVAPRPIGLRGCCIIQYTCRKKGGKREDRVKISKKKGRVLKKRMSIVCSPKRCVFQLRSRDAAALKSSDGIHSPQRKRQSVGRRRDGIFCGRLGDDRLLPVADVDVAGRAGVAGPDRERRNLGYGRGRRPPEFGI